MSRSTMARNGAGQQPISNDVTNRLGVHGIDHVLQRDEATSRKNPEASVGETRPSIAQGKSDTATG